MATKKRKAKKSVKIPAGLKDAVAFFYKNAGSSHDPKKETLAQGRRRGAIALAKAEAEAKKRGWDVEWEQEQDPDLSWVEDGEEAGETLCAVLRDENGKVLTSLGNVTFGTNSIDARKYRRVVEAELALEAL